MLKDSMLRLHPAICQKTSARFEPFESTPNSQPFPLSPRERAGVRGNRSPNNLTLPNALASLHEPAPPHPYPLPRGEGTAFGGSPKCRRIPCHLRIQLFARKPPPIQPPRKHSHRPTIPPLPKGEGRGEGEQDSRALFHYERLLQEGLCTTCPPGIREKTSSLSNPHRRCNCPALSCVGTPIRTRQPWPRLLEISICPPINSVIRLAMINPRPAPCCSKVFRSNCMCGPILEICSAVSPRP